MEEELNKALSVAWRIIGIRPRSVFEIRRKLNQKRFNEEIIKEVIDKLESLELLDDKKFARQWTEERLRNRACGKLLIKKKLMDKGIDEEIVNNISEELLPQKKEVELARKIIENRDKEPRQKKVFFLRSKGFGWEIISEVLDS